MRPIALTLLATLLCAPLFAQSPAPTDSPTPPPARAGVSSISPDERDKLRAASQAAQKDPDVIAAEAKFHAAIKAATDLMITKDASLKPILDKVEAGDRPDALHLTPDEQAKLRAGREAIAGTPELDAWQAATTAYLVAMRKAMIASDPSVADILAKLPHAAINHISASPAAASPAAASPAASPSAAQ